MGWQARGVVLFYPGENKEWDLSWNMGVTTNNHVEECTLWMALKLLDKREIRHIEIYDDSQIIVNSINQNLVDIKPPLDHFLF